MKVSRKKSYRPLIIALIVVAAFCVLLFILEKSRVTDFIKDPTYKAPVAGPTAAQTKQAEQTATQEKEQYLDSVAKQQTTAAPAAVPTDTSTITLSATQSGDSVVVRNELHGQGYSSGSCVLTITNGSKTTTQKAEIMYQPEYSMCAGFSVPVSTIGAGNWNIS